MARDHRTAVGDAVEVRLRPVPAHVVADGPPERSGPPETVAEHQPGQSSGDHAEDSLAGIAELERAKANRKQDRRRPEADGAREYLLQVTAQGHLLGHTDEEERNAPLEREPNRHPPGDREAVECQMTREHEDPDQTRKRYESPEGAPREVAVRLSVGQSIRPAGAMFNAPHDPGRDDDRQAERRELGDDETSWTRNGAHGGVDQSRRQEGQGYDDSNEESCSPADPE